MKVLGIDPGFSAMGWAVATVADGSVELETMGVIRTEKSLKKTNTRSSEDNIARARVLHNSLCSIVMVNAVKLIATETMSWPRNAGVVAKMGIAWGCIASVSAQYCIPIVQASPMILKRAVTGNGKASKEDIISAIRAMYPSVLWPSRVDMHEHAADAVGSIIACRDSELMRFAYGF